MTDTHATRRVAEYAAGLQFSDLPEATVEHAKQAVLDLLGIAIRASGEPGSSAVLRRVVGELGGEGDATVAGIGARYRPHYAALLNAAFAHTLDFDDTHQRGSIHPGAPVIPAALAIAEERAASGRELIEGIVAGYDVTVRLSEAAIPAHQYDRGFHPTATAGTFGATAAVARVARAGADLLENAFGINGSQAAGSLQFLENGAWNKRIHVGLTAHNAILAYRLAAAGAQGASSAIEGASGFFRGYTDDADAARLTASLGAPFAIDETGFKPYPSCRYSHAAIDALLDILAETKADVRRIDAVRIGLPRTGMQLVGVPESAKRHPVSIVDGQFSMFFCAAVTLLRRRFTWEEYALLGDPEVDATIRKISVEQDPRVEALFPGMAATVEVQIGERTIRRLNDTPRGEPEKPLAWDDLVTKFDGLAGALYGAARRERIVAAARRLERLPDVRELTSLLTGPDRDLGPNTGDSVPGREAVFEISAS